MAALNRLRGVVENRFGIQLEGKETLVRGRLSPLARQGGFDTVDAFVHSVLDDPGTARLSEVIDVLTTNHTHFHREAAHFDRLRDEILPALIERREAEGVRDLRIWCAAAATGQEPYTLAMIVHEVLGSAARRWSTSILATDISARALETAREGLFSKKDVQKLPANRQRWFSPVGDQMKIAEDIRRAVIYRRLNLLRSSYPFKTPMDVVFCRNVMIYFDHDTKVNIVRSMARVMDPGSWLIISLSETLPRVEGLGFRFVKPGVYQRT